MWYNCQMMTYNLNMTFTRPDENDAHVYECGYCAYGPDVVDWASAEAMVRRRSSHLTIIKITPFAIVDEDGNRVVEANG
jgi:hypothetical protein